MIIQGMDSQAAAAPPPPSSGVDTRAVARNVLANWSGHCVTLAAGFILPRLINDQIGQVRLGLWDFAWSIAGSFFILTGGIGSAVNRYVAHYRAVSDWPSLNRTVSACMALYLVCTAVALALAAAASWWIHLILPATLETGLWEARTVVFLLGIAMVVQLPFATYHGVITGHQRYDVATWIETGCRIAGVLLMIVALLLGYGLIALSVLTVLRELSVGLLKYAAARHVCPVMRLSFGGIRRSDLKAVLAFGGKTYMNFAADITLYQFNRVVVGAYLGPIALAMFARPLGLVNSCQQVIYHFGRVLTPLASDIQASRQSANLTDLLMRTARYSVLLSLPMVLFLIAFGDGLMRLWMGEGYEVGNVLAILAVGHLSTFVQIGPYHILLGMNRHGLPALATFVAGCVSVLSSFIGLTMGGFGLQGAALSMVIPLTIAHGLIVPLCAARAVGLPLRRYLFALGVPALMVVPFAMTITAVRLLMGDETLRTIILASALGGVVLGASVYVARKTSLGDRVFRMLKREPERSACPREVSDGAEPDASSLAPALAEQ